MADKHTDLRTNISYINPSESSLEINELTNDEFKKLIKEFEGLGEFDVVVVDFDGEFSKDKAVLLSSMDKVFVPFISEGLSMAKTALFLKELKMYDELKEIYDKIYLVLNKANGKSDYAVNINRELSNERIAASIPLSPILSDIKNILNSNNSILSAMMQITKNI